MTSSDVTINKACDHVNNGAEIKGKRKLEFLKKKQIFITSLCAKCFSNSIFGEVIP